MSRSDTVELLNETGDLEQKMAWILFKQEIAHIWDGGENDWHPGDPCHVVGVVVRPMYQLIPMDEWTSYPIRCKGCETYWAGDQPCWNCGEECPLPDYLGGKDVSQFFTYVSLDVDMFDDTYLSVGPFSMQAVRPHSNSDIDIASWLREEMRQTLSEEMSRVIHQMLWGNGRDHYSISTEDEEAWRRANRSISSTPRQNGRGIRGARPQRIILDEWVSSHPDPEPDWVTVEVDETEIRLPAGLDTSGYVIHDVPEPFDRIENNRRYGRLVAERTRP